MTWTSRWNVTTIGVQPGVAGDKTRLDNALKELWEPYAVTWGDGRFVYHLRRIETTKDKK